MGTLSVWFLYAMAMFWIIVGVLLIFSPKLLVDKFGKKVKTASPVSMSIIAFVISLCLLIAASHNRFVVFVRLLGILGIAKGVAFLAVPDKMKKMTDWWFKANATVKRAWGVLAVLIGSIVLMGI
jgi:hypothetical protein